MGTADGFVTRSSFLAGHQAACFKVPTPNAKKGRANTPATRSRMQWLCFAGPPARLWAKENDFQNSFGCSERSKIEISRDYLFLEVCWCSQKFYVRMSSDMLQRVCIPIFSMFLHFYVVLGDGPKQHCTAPTRLPMLGWDSKNRHIDFVTFFR